MVAPVYNALAAKTVLAAKPVPSKGAVQASPAPQTKQPVQRVAPGPNSKPNKDANAGQSPAMVGDRQKITRPAYQTIAPSPAAPARSSEQRSGMEGAMSALADKTHPVRRRGG